MPYLRFGCTLFTAAALLERGFQCFQQAIEAVSVARQSLISIIVLGIVFAARNHSLDLAVIISLFIHLLSDFLQTVLRSLNELIRELLVAIALWFSHFLGRLVMALVDRCGESILALVAI